jgi:hypothetical protein
LGGDTRAAVGAAGVGVSEDNGLAFEVGEVFFGAGTVEGDEGIPELAEDGEGGFSVEFEPVERGFEEVAATDEGEQERGDEKPERQGRTGWGRRWVLGWLGEGHERGGKVARFGVRRTGNMALRMITF